jgi:hypothetical protein
VGTFASLSIVDGAAAAALVDRLLNAGLMTVAVSIVAPAQAPVTGWLGTRRSRMHPALTFAVSAVSGIDRICAPEP